MITDMSVGKPFSVLWRFSVPMMVSVMFQQLYSIVDSVVAGQYAGADGLAAVGASYPVTTLFLAVAAGLNIGASVVISQLFGRRRYEEMKTAVSTALLLCVAYSMLTMTIGYLSRHWVLDILRTPEDIYAGSDTYLSIYIYGLLFLFLYNICNGVFAALGDSRTPLCFLILSSLLNIGLDLYFTAGLGMGVTGVAWATFAAQGLASVLALVFLLVRLREVKTGPYVKYSSTMARKINRVAFPSMLQQASISLGNMVIQSMVNGYGSAVMAGYAAGVKVNTFASISLTTLGNAYSNFAAQNMGAGKWERVREGFRDCLKMLYLAAFVVILLYQSFTEPLILMFLKGDQVEAVAAGVQFLRVVSPAYLWMNLKVTCDGVLRGSGSMGEFMFATMADLGLRCICAAILSCLFHDPVWIWASWHAGWGAGAAITYYFYKRERWKEHLL